jgi:hypothetical protein
LLEWLARYPEPGADNAGDIPSVTDAVGVAAGSDAKLIEALETVQQRGGRIRAWVVGDAELDIAAPIQRVGTEWPL